MSVLFLAWDAPMMATRRANSTPTIPVVISRIRVLPDELGGPAAVLIAFRRVGHSQSPLIHETKEKR